MITNLKVQIEEDKIMEEELKEQLEGRDMVIGNLESEIVTLRNDLQKKNMKNNSKVLNDIINSQKPHHDKYGSISKSNRKGINIQNSRTRNISKKLCKNNQRVKEGLQRKLQGHSSMEKIQISKSMTNRNI